MEDALYEVIHTGMVLTSVTILLLHLYRSSKIFTARRF